MSYRPEEYDALLAEKVAATRAKFGEVLGSVEPEPFEQLKLRIAALGGGKRRTIHLAFGTRRLDGTKANMMYVLTSSLLLPHTQPATEEVVAYEFDEAWDAPNSEEPAWAVTLPVQHSATHRIALAAPARDGAARSLLVSGLVSSVLFQILPPPARPPGS